MKCLGAIAAALAALTFGAAAFAAPAADDLRHVRITAPGEGPVSETLSLPVNKAAVVELPRQARDVLVANPAIADAVIRTPTQVYLLGMSAGQTNVFFFDAAGNEILDLELNVATDVSALQTMLDRYVTGGGVRAEAVNNQIVLTGGVPSSLAADQAVKLARRWVEDADNVFSMINITGAEQVMLKVRVVEMQRSVLKQLGVNINGLEGLGGGDSVTFETTNSFGVNGSPRGGLDAALDIMGGDSLFGADLQAFESVGLVRTLAEPNLTAISGESANFLAGGEFPVPVGRDRDGNVTIEFKPFGVGLGFTPVVLGEGRISLKISTEVSELTNQGALNIESQTVIDDNGNPITIAGVNIPALNVRRSETTVEMPSGGSLVMAGLIQEETRQSMDGVPGVKDIPVLGALFRSRDFINEETELVIIVTPYLVNPTAPENLSTPADGYRNSNDANAILMGQLNQVYAVPGAAQGQAAWRGPHGYVLE